MDNGFAISGNGLAGTLVRPSAFIIAVAGGLIVPGAQVEAGMQPDALQGAGFQSAGVTTGLTPRTNLADMRPDPDVLTLADVMGPHARPAGDASASALMYDPTLSRAVTDQQSGDGISGSLKITALKIASGNPDTLSFSRAVDGMADDASGKQRFADAFPVDAFAGGPDGSDAGLVAPSASPALSAGDLSGNASTSALELVAFDPFAVKPQPAAEIAKHLAPQLSAKADAIEFVSNPVVQPLPRQELAAKPAIAAVPAATAALAGKDLHDTPRPQPMAAARSSSLALAEKAPAPRTKTIQASPARSSTSAALATPRPLSTPKVVSGRHMPGYRLAGDVIEFAMAIRVNGQPAAPIPLRVTKDDRLWLRTGDLLSLVRTMMPQDQYDRLAASSAIDEYITFDQVRSAGIGLRYDVARNLIAIDSD